MSGWKLVPVEPTKEMVEAGFDAVPGAFEGLISARWRCMLAAAPQPPSQWPASRPMSEAPRDTPVLAWWPAEKQWCQSWHVPAQKKWECSLSDIDDPQPTCWLPMPPAPTEQETTPWFNARRDPPVNGGPYDVYEWRCKEYAVEKCPKLTIVYRGIRCGLCQWRGLLRE